MHDPISPTPDEMAAAQAWWDTHLAGDAWPFSLLIDGVRVVDPAGWTVERATRDPDAERQELTVTACHPDHGLVLRCVAVRYRRHPVVEWALHLEQTAAGHSPMVSEVLGVDAVWQHGKDQPFLVRTYEGDDHLLRTIFQPHEHAMHGGRQLSMAPASNAGQDPEGRCSSGAFPYFTVEEAGTGRCLERPLAKGFHVAIGWPGRWTATLAQDKDCLRIQAGQDRPRFRLEPGESYQAPLVALCFFGGPDRLRAMNLWRRWMLACNLPRLNGALPPPMLEASTCGFFDEMGRATEANQIEYIERFRQAAPDLTHWWMDAGWYPCRPRVAEKNSWWITGTWEVDRDRFPNGLRRISDHAHSQGIRTILWFEPERVAGSTWLFRERPQSFDKTVTFLGENTGLPVYMTELRVHTDTLKKAGLSAEQIDEKLADYLEDLFTVAYGNPHMAGFYIWGNYNLTVVREPSILYQRLYSLIREKLARSRRDRRR